MFVWKKKKKKKKKKVKSWRDAFCCGNFREDRIHTVALRWYSQWKFIFNNILIYVFWKQRKTFFSIFDIVFRLTKEIFIYLNRNTMSCIWTWYPDLYVEAVRKIYQFNILFRGKGHKDEQKVLKEFTELNFIKLELSHLGTLALAP